MTTRRELLIAFGSVIAAPRTSKGQQPGKIYRIGLLQPSEPPAAYVEAFLQALKALGYIEGKNIAFEARVAGGKVDRLPALAAELVSLKVDVIIAESSDGIRSARAATRTIPIIMLSAGDPVGAGFITSLARPGGNVTGLTNMNVNLRGKLLEILKDMVPNLGHVGLLRSVSSAVENSYLKDTEIPAKALKIKITPLMVRGPEDYERAFQSAAKLRVQALLVTLPNVASTADRKPIIDLAARSRLPAIFDGRVWSEDGALISYGADRLELRRRAAAYVDKLLKGANPAELPVEQPTKFELVVNLKTAKTLGIKFPQSVLVRADKVIE
jgi:putative ABC transport system substrate-binding protein